MRNLKAVVPAFIVRMVSCLSGPPPLCSRWEAWLPPSLRTGSALRLLVRHLLLMVGDVRNKPAPKICSGCSKLIKWDFTPGVCTNCQRQFHRQFTAISRYSKRAAWIFYQHNLRWKRLSHQHTTRLFAQPATTGSTWTVLGKHGTHSCVFAVQVTG